MVPDDIKIPGYSLKKRLGRGGMASVFLAVNESTKKRIALKIMSNQLGEESVWAKRFIQEAQVIAQLSHPNVVPVYDVGTHEGQFYIAMELLQGGSLKDRMSNGIDIASTLKIVAGIAAGLDYASEKGFVHRDIKPDNIMFRENGDPVILDFGIVKQMDQGASKMTQTGTIIGTSAYMSPEQAQGNQLDQRSDIYSLGILFYELLTGHPPFQGDTDVSTILMHITEPVPSLQGPLAVFQPIIDKSLAKDPFHRYARAREIIDHIQALEADIRSAVQQLNAAASNADDATAMLNKADLDDATAMMSSNEDSTRSMNTNPQITAEEDLTKVLSSAKATIRDFSVDARRRKARRTKNAVFAALTVASVAIAYIGYYQLHVVPQERAQAEAKIRENEEKSRKKINALLADAESARSSLQADDLDSADNVIAIYRQVLKLDPDNSEAETQLQNLGERYINLASRAVERGDVNKALNYREYAEALVPESPDLAELRRIIKAKRAEELEKEFVQEEIDTLLAVAREDIKRSGGFSDTAYTKIQQVLRLDPGNASADRLLQSTLKQLQLNTESALQSGDLNFAAEQLELMEKYHPDETLVTKLNDTFARKNASAQNQVEIARLKKQAERLELEKRNIAVNDQLRSIYQKIKRLAPNDTNARKGITEASDFEGNLARKAIEERDFKRAQKHITNIAKFQSNYSGLSALEKELNTSLINASKSEALLQEARNAISQKVAGEEEKRKQLSLAYQKIDQAKNLDKTHPGIRNVLRELESEYVKVVKQLLSSDKNELAQAYFEDTSKINWPSDRLFELQQIATKNVAQEKPEKKTKHIISGGF